MFDFQKRSSKNVGDSQQERKVRIQPKYRTGLLSFPHVNADAINEGNNKFPFLFMF